MKKYFLLLAAAATLFAVSCSRETDAKLSVTGQTAVIDDSVPMPVVFTSEYALTKAPEIETKGLGAIDDWHGAAQQLYVYGYVAYRNGQGVHATETIDLTQPMFENIAANAPVASSDSEGVRLDNSQRAKINVYNPNAIGGSASQEPFYYYETDVNGDPAAFSFFGYFVDDAVVDPAPVVDPAAGTIVLSDLELDGTRDIMLASTDKEIDALTRSRYFDKETYQTTELDDQALAEYVDPTRIYSAHAARRGVNPDLIFEHQMSRFTFYIKKGGTVPSDMIEIERLTVSDYTDGTLTILGGENGLADRGLVPEGAIVDNALTLRNADGSPLGGLHSGIHPTSEYEKLGQSLLVFPGRTDYDMTLGIYQTGATADPFYPYLSNIKIHIPEDENGAEAVAEKGMNYNIYLIVYGLEEVRISVTLTKWEDAEIFIDPDQDDDDLREAATIILGSDRTFPNLPDGEVISYIGDDVTKAYETEDDALAYVDPYHTPSAHLTIRTCDKIDLLSTQQWNPIAHEYEDVLAFVRSTSNGVFHFSSADNAGIFTLTDAGLIEAVAVGEGTVVVRQNSSNDFLAAPSRTIKVKIVEDNRIPVTINWDNQESLVINEEGAENTIDFLASFTIGAPFGKTYFANYHEMALPEYTRTAWYADRQLAAGSPADNGPAALVEEITGEVPYAFGLKFETVDDGPIVSSEYLRVDPITGIITLIKPTPAGIPAQVKVNFYNLLGDDWYTPTQKVIDVVINRNPIVVDGVAAAYEVAYGEAFTIKPVITPGANAPTYVSDAPAVATVGENSGIVTGIAPGTATVTLTVAQNQFVEGTVIPIAITVVKATPKVSVDAKEIWVGDAPAALNVRITNKAGEDISALVGAVTFSNNGNDGVFTVDASGNITAVGPGRATVTVNIAGNANYNAVSKNATILVKAH